MSDREALAEALGTTLVPALSTALNSALVPALTEVLSPYLAPPQREPEVPDEPRAFDVPFRLRVQNRRNKKYMNGIKGKLISDYATVYGPLLTGHTRVTMPNGKLLCHYLPGALAHLDTPALWDILSSVKIETSNRATATGSETRSDPGYKRKYYKKVYSGTIGNLEANGKGAILQYCRQTSWSQNHEEYLPNIGELLDTIHDLMRTHEGDRYGVQMRRAEATNPAFIIDGTPWTTITHNNTYPTGVHVDSGDLDSGVSVIATFSRRAQGAELCFPEWGVAAPMYSGDLILMDAHQYHANMPLIVDGKKIQGLDDAIEVTGKGYGRISLVLYYRTKMLDCGTEEQEQLKRETEKAQFERRRKDYIAAVAEQEAKVKTTTTEQATSYDE